MPLCFIQQTSAELRSIIETIKLPEKSQQSEPLQARATPASRGRKPRSSKSCILHARRGSAPPLITAESIHSQQHVTSCLENASAAPGGSEFLPPIVPRSVDCREDLAFIHYPSLSAVMRETGLWQRCLVTHSSSPLLQTHKVLHDLQ